MEQVNAGMRVAVGKIDHFCGQFVMVQEEACYLELQIELVDIV